MDIDYLDDIGEEFDAELYIRLLVAIAKADRNNGPPEYAYVKRLANRLSVDFVRAWNDTGRNFSFESGNVPRKTTMLLIKDGIMLASLDGNFTLEEKERVYRFAEKLDIPRTDVDAVAKWLAEYRELVGRWQALAME